MHYGDKGTMSTVRIKGRCDSMTWKGIFTISQHLEFKADDGVCNIMKHVRDNLELFCLSELYSVFISG